MKKLHSTYIGLSALFLMTCATARTWAQTPQQARIAWNYNLHAGDCEMAKPVLVFRSDGTGTFKCHVMTHFTHSKDYWHQSFDIFDARNTKLFHLGEWTSMPLSERDNPTWHDWQVTFTFPADQFKLISKAVVHGRG